MRIDGLTPAARQALMAAAAGNAAADTAKFAADAAPPPPPAATPTGALAAPPTSVAMLVALASVDPVAERRRKQAMQADRGLGLLESLRDQLAAGIVAPAQLQEMNAWVGQVEVPDDPALADILRDIELRVRVELAKHDLTA